MPLCTMCHGELRLGRYLTEEMAAKRRAERERRRQEAAEADELPSFLNDERETAVEVLTDGGT